MVGNLVQKYMIFIKKYNTILLNIDIFLIFLFLCAFFMVTPPFLKVN